MGNYILTSNGELYHYGVKGMKWGHRKTQANIDAYKKNQALKKKVESEGQRLMSKSKSLSRDFGGKYSNVDDTEFFELQARKRGLNTDAYWKAEREHESYYSQNKKAIRKGEKAAAKSMKNVTKNGNQDRTMQALGTLAVVATGASIAAELMKKSSGR